MEPLARTATETSGAANQTPRRTLTVHFIALDFAQGHVVFEEPGKKFVAELPTHDAAVAYAAELNAWWAARPSPRVGGRRAPDHVPTEMELLVLLDKPWLNDTAA